MASEKNYNPQTILSYELTLHQNVLVHYLIPSVSSCCLYIFLITSECGVIFRHYKDENPIWASLTLFFMYFPALCSYIITISSLELWPNPTGYGRENCAWFFLKTLQHLFFPIWALWRFAERIFWAIEAYRSYDETMIKEALEYVSAPRNIELYFFFQAFLHSLPQMLLQLNIILKREADMNKQTADAQILSLVFNLAKVASTIAFYQRFKSQKLAGKQYPWFKPHKYVHDQSIDEVDNDKVDPSGGLILNSEQLELWEEPKPSESRRSSDFYMEPSTSTDLKPLKEVAGCLRETSVIDGPNRKVYKEISEPDFNIRRVLNIKGLPEDDLAGRLVSFCWWSCFLLARVLAISAFNYFYPLESIWLLSAHFLVVIAFLIYDVKTDNVKRAKAIFFIFLGLIYIFCIIEFKIKFKKTKFIYIGYFTLVFVENFSMCLVWWIKNVDDLTNDFWFRYMFYLIIFCSIISVSSMILYLNINKPDKVVVGTKLMS